MLASPIISATTTLVTVLIIDLTGSIAYGHGIYRYHQWPFAGEQLSGRRGRGGFRERMNNHVVKGDHAPAIIGSRHNLLKTGSENAVSRRNRRR